VRTIHDGKETIYLPGSSIKGVFRSRYEHVMRAVGQYVCDTFDSKHNDTCNKNIRKEENDPKINRHLDGAERYALCCEACKLFGTLVLGGRISFADAYPVGEWKVGMRHGVGIDRVTGAAFPGALYDIETLENGSFTVKCKMMNFRLYQLRTVMWVLEDIEDGLVTFGMGGSRGNGQMRIVGDVNLDYRKYSDDAPVLSGTEVNSLLYQQTKISGQPDILEALNISTREELIGAIKAGR
jgi:CRISPR-associated RAMP protein (TIGR02581 family)